MVGQMKHMPMLATQAVTISAATAVQQQAGGQPGGHQAKAEFQRVEIAETRGEFAGLPGGNSVNQADQRREQEILAVVEAELVAEEEIEVIEINHHREGVDALDGVTGGAEFLGRGHRAEISSMALRQYHFTASVIGGVSLSKSAALHQRMS